VLPVAGFGTRVLPATKAIPKEMLPVFDRPALQYVVDEALEAGIKHIVFVTGRNKGAIEDYFDHQFELESSLKAKSKTAILEELDASKLPAGASSFVRQQTPSGLGHAVWCARDVVGDEPFAVLLPDVLVKNSPGCLRQMVDAYARTGGNLIAVDSVPLSQVHLYGVIAPEGASQDKLTRMKGMVEKPKTDAAPSTLRITGRYILQPEIFGLLGNQSAGAGGEIQLTDAMARLLTEQDFHAFEFEGVCYDCGDKIGYLTAFAAYALGHEALGTPARAAIQQELER
jgi:UTP--glucose-1-phosphate uridylyltransferase